MSLSPLGVRDITEHPEILYVEPEFEGFVLRAVAGVLSKDDAVAMAIRTEGPSLAITMSRAQARLLAFELIKAVGGTDQDADLPHHQLPAN